MAMLALHVVMDTFLHISTLFIGDDFTICEGNTATIDAGPGKETYLWSTGATTQSIDVDDPGDYWVRVTREDCMLSDTFIWMSGQVMKILDRMWRYAPMQAQI